TRPGPNIPLRPNLGVLHLSHQTIIPKPNPYDLQASTETITPRRLTKRAIRIAQSKALSPSADEPASLSRDDRHGEAFPTVSSLNAGGIIDIGEELRADKGTEKGSNDTEEMVNVLSSMEAANIFVSPTDVFPTAGVPTVSGSFPTVSAIFTTASVATPYTRRSRGITIGSLRPMRIPIISAKDKGKEKVTETEVPKKKKLQEQIDAQVARDMEEEFARENQSEYEQAESDLSVGEKIELVKYQDHLVEILKYQAQQSKPSSKKEQRRFYMSVLKSHAGWKTEHFRGMKLE
nr:hypothetical protein [Tanacetum cinerariifolium]